MKECVLCVSAHLSVCCLSPGITVLLSLTVFMLLVAEIMPATSDSVPLIGETPFSALIIAHFDDFPTLKVMKKREKQFRWIAK